MYKAEYLVKNNYYNVIHLQVVCLPLFCTACVVLCEEPRAKTESFCVRECVRGLCST